MKIQRGGEEERNMHVIEMYYDNVLDIAIFDEEFKK